MPPPRERTLDRPAIAAPDALRQLLQRPELRPLVGATEIVLGDAGPGGFVVPSSGKLIVAAEALAAPAAAVILRHGLELAWLSTIRSDAPATLGLLAARTAALYLMIEPASARAAADPLLETLGGDLPSADALCHLWRRLAALQDASPDAIGPRDLDIVADLWPLAGPAEQLMTTGGDERLRLDPATGLNKYGCAPRPRPWVVTFASSTASSISERGYGAAEACRRRILRAALLGRADAGLRQETALIRAGILSHWGIADRAEAILVPSGTDAALLSTALIRAESAARPLTAVLMSPLETGSGIPSAATGHHFAGTTALGEAVTARDCVPGFPPDVRLATVAARTAGGGLRSNVDVASDLDRTIGSSAVDGNVLLHLLDSSKTGLVTPDPALLATLRHRHGERFSAVIDACQARTGPRQIARYLADGHMVLVTGSKFFTGPPFCGAVLIQRDRLARILANGALPAGLSAYSRAADWPGAAPAEAAAGGNIGLTLRWAAALAEMTGFAAVPQARRIEILDRFTTGLAARLATGDRLVPIPSPPPARPEQDGWDTRQTIFPFAIRDPKNPAALMDMAGLDRVYRWLNTDLSAVIADPVAALLCHIGQPVRLGEQDGRAFGALRIAAGARLISGEPSHAGLEDDARLERELADLGAVVAKLGLILDALPVLQELS